MFSVLSVVKKKSLIRINTTEVIESTERKKIFLSASLLFLCADGIQQKSQLNEQ
jgi:hypothetical protein